MATVLLTGGTGYIGSHTAVEMLNSGHHVIIADNLSNSEASVVENVEGITGKSVKFYAVDVMDKASLDRIFCENDIDAVIHFAGYKVVGESVQNPIAYYRNNLDTTLTLLEVMRAHDVRRIVFSSSANVYGLSDVVPVTEDMKIGDCTNPYGWTKYMIEQILKDAAKAFPELSAVLLRYFNPVGAHESGLIGEKVNGVPSNLMPYITQVAAGIREKLFIYGGDYPTRDGTGIRDFIHVVDLAKGHVSAVDYAMKHTGAEIFNLGTGKGYSVLEMVYAFEAANGIKVPYEIAPRRPGDIVISYAGTEKAERMLGWKAEKGLEEMCRDAWRWQQNCEK